MTTEPGTLSQSIAELIDRYPPGSHLHEAAQMIARETRRCQARRAAVLSHPDLAARLTEPDIGYSKPSDWNGWIPPAFIRPGSAEELLQSPTGRLNQRGKRAAGEEPNDSPRRAALVEIATEAWNRREQVS